MVVAIITTLAAIGYPIYATALARAKITKAIGDIRVLSTETGEFKLFDGGYPLSLDDIGQTNFVDPYGNPYEYLNFAAALAGGGGGIAGIARKDRFLVPINSDYDLYSKGEDGVSALPLTAATSRDDIVLANEGGYIGLASEY